MSDNIEKDLKNSKGDIAYTTAKAGLSMIVARQAFCQ